MNNAAYFILKVLVSGLIVAATSWLAGRKPFLAGFIVALPLVSLLSLAFVYLETRDMQKINDYATSIFVAVPLSMAFFGPFILNRWLHLNFCATLIFALLFLFGAFLIHGLIVPTK